MVRALGVSTVDSAVLLMTVGEGQNLGCSGRGLAGFKNYCTMVVVYSYMLRRRVRQRVVQEGYGVITGVLCGR
jgi:hypothetical protein